MSLALDPAEIPDLPALAAIPIENRQAPGKVSRGAHSDHFSRGWTAAELMRTDFPEPRWAVRGFFPEGATLLAGESKIGKSWLALGLSIAVASGGRAFGHIPVEAGRVLYIGFEDNPRRMRSRLSRLLEDHAAPELLHIYHEWPKLGLPESNEKSGLDWLNAWMRKYPDTRLVVIDTFKLIRPNRKRHGNIYDEDYEDSHLLQQFASRAGVALLGIHHTNQGRHEDDPFHAISGSEGLNAGFDTIAVLRRSATSSAGSLNIRGRDVGEFKHAVSYDFQTMQWTLPGYKLSREREDLIAVLRAAAPNDVGYTDFATRLGKTENAAKQLAVNMYAEGQILKRSPGRYYLKPTNDADANNGGNGTDGDNALLPLPALAG